MTAFAAGGKPKRSIESIRIERTYRNVLTLFLSGQLPSFTHERHVHVANILRHLPYGRELMHLGVQTMAYRLFVPDKFSRDTTDFWWDCLDGTLPDPALFADLPGGAGGEVGVTPSTGAGPDGPFAGSPPRASSSGHLRPREGRTRECRCGCPPRGAAEQGAAAGTGGWVNAARPAGARRRRASGRRPGGRSRS